MSSVSGLITVSVIFTNDTPSVDKYTPGSASVAATGAPGVGPGAPPPAPGTTPIIKPVSQSTRSSVSAGSVVTVEWVGVAPPAPLTSTILYTPSSLPSPPLTVMKAVSATDAAEPTGQYAIDVTPPLYAPS